VSTPEVEILHQQLIEKLAAAGTLGEDWRPAFEAVSRHAFMPDLTWYHSRTGLVPRYRAEDPDGWLSAAYDDDSVVTQVADGEPCGPDGTGVLPTSSASMPTVVAVMLEALDVHDGQYALEIGTGTGYNAALLAHRLGPDHVTSVEIDPLVADAARHALAQTGYGGITVVTADGTQGFSPRAPYHRVLSTASCQQVPYSWVSQTVPGGKVLTPWSNAYYPGGLLSLTVAADGPPPAASWSPPGSCSFVTSARRSAASQMSCMAITMGRSPRLPSDPMSWLGTGEPCWPSAWACRSVATNTSLMTPPTVRASCGSLIRGLDHGPVISISHRIAATTSSACASEALAGCGTRYAPPTAGGPSGDDQRNRTGYSPCTPAVRASI
jgi:protein-L-isoaspartate O-methyltransferase